MSYNDYSELSRVNEELRHEIIERQKTEMQLEHRNRLLSTLLDVSNLVSSTMELRPLLEAILDRLKNIIDYKGAKIFIVEGKELKVLAHRSVLPVSEEADYSFNYKKVSLGHEIIVRKKPVVISDIYSDDTLAVSFREAIHEYLNGIFSYMKSWMGIPLIVKNKVIGVLTLDHDITGFYHDVHTEVGMAFANQAALEFENARLYNETIKKADELKTMFSVQQAITSRLELDTVLQLIADEAKRLTHSSRTAVFMVDGNDLVLSVFSGQDTARFVGYRLPIDKTFAGKALMYGKPIIVNDAQANAEAYPGLVMNAGVKSFITIPLIVGDKHVGMISAVDKTNGEFNHEDEHILSVLASSAVIGIENARLYQEERRRHLEDQQRRHVAEGLRDILGILNSNRPLAEILEYIVQQAVHFTGTDTGALYRLQKDKGILTVRAACGLSEEYIKEMSVPVGKGAIGRAVLERKPFAVTDIAAIVPEEALADEQRRPHLLWVMEKFNGLLAVPLLCKNEVYGGILLYYNEPKDFKKEEVELAMTFADQAALAIDNARLRAQAEEMAVAAERSRLARDLHDAVTQTLFSASLIAEVVPKIWVKKPEEGMKRLEELRQLTRGALAEMRTLLLELRPATLVEANIDDLLKHLTEATTGRARIPVSLEVGARPELPTDVKIAFYRIAQEALNNIVKHSGADEAAVSLKTYEATKVVQLQITDNGRGFNPDEISGDHLGVGIMQERAESALMKLYIDSCIGQGTKITLTWENRKGDM